jgi:hypothetical protein
MLGFLIYLPTIEIIPHLMFIFAFIFIIIKNNEIKSSSIRLSELNYFNIIIVLMIISFSLVNRIFSPENINNFSDAFPYQFLLIFTVIIALNITKLDIKVLLIFIFIESLFVIYEFYIGDMSVFGSNLIDTNETYLLQMRPYGLSRNSSNVASKLFLFFVLSRHYLKKDKLIKYMTPFVIIALLLTFNRTAMICTIFFYFLYIFCQIYLNKITKFELYLFISLIIISGYFANQYFEIIEMQLTGGQGKFRTFSIRENIWGEYFYFIKENLFFGNNSYKYLIKYKGLVFHAHNSFIQTLATNGIIIFLLYLLILTININRKNFIYIFPILLFAIPQYTIFWGISLEDITFFSLLFNNNT